MNKTLLVTFIITSTNSYSAAGHNAVSNPVDLIPAGYTVVAKSVGDLNKDKQDDYVFIIKSTNKNEIVHDEQRGELDRNRRGIIIALRDGDKYRLTAKNLACFSSENEDGGVYYAPELDVGIMKGNLDVSYSHGRYGYWSYTFRFQHGKFEMIGYDSSEDRGPVIERVTSINFSTQKMLFKENTNLDAESGDEQFKETWTKIPTDKLIDLEKIHDFDELDRESLLDMVRHSKN